MPILYHQNATIRRKKAADPDSKSSYSRLLVSPPSFCPDCCWPSACCLVRSLSLTRDDHHEVLNSTIGLSSNPASGSKTFSPGRHVQVRRWRLRREAGRRRATGYGYIPQSRPGYRRFNLSRRQPSTTKRSQESTHSVSGFGWSVSCNSYLRIIS